MIVANKGDTVTEIIDKIKNIYKLLPFFLKPGIVNWNSKSIVFDNGCRIKSQARSKEPAIGFTIDFLYMDEFAHLPNSIARHYYKAAVPTVSSINNSKILITSTPNGSNLFKELVNGAELPEGHPDKNQYKCIRVYWYEVEGRLDPKFYPMQVDLKKHKISFKDIDRSLKKLGIKTKIESETTDTGEKEYIRIDYEKGKYPIEKIREIKINDIMLSQLGVVTNWRETETKLIGGEESFNQEYGIQFLSGAKRILSVKTSRRLDERKTKYVWEKIDVLDKLRFGYDELVWDPEFVHNTRNDYNWVTSIDTSEGLGLDYTVLNMHRVMPRDIEWLNSNKIKNLYEAFYLKQTALFRHNRLHPKETADLFYLLHFNYFDPNNLKVVLEMNGPGGRFLDALPNCFDQNNNFGNYIFVRYKHNKNDKFKKVGKKVNSNKKDDVKLYIDAVENDTIYMNEENTILEAENFIKVETKSGNYTYKADSGNDDIIMTEVNMSTIFETQEWKNMCHDIYNKLDSATQSAIDSALDLNYNPQAMGYKSVSNALKAVKNGYTNKKGFKK